MKYPDEWDWMVPCLILFSLTRLYSPSPTKFSLKFLVESTICIAVLPEFRTIRRILCSASIRNAFGRTQARETTGHPFWPRSRCCSSATAASCAPMSPPKDVGRRFEERVRRGGWSNFAPSWRRCGPWKSKVFALGKVRFLLLYFVNLIGKNFPKLYNCTF